MSTMDTALGSGNHVVAAAPAWQHPAPVEDIVVVRDAVVATQTLATGAATDSAPAHPVSVVVLAPHDEVYDSLWRIAQRTLGDGLRWPEIFDLNKGKPQPNGRLSISPLATVNDASPHEADDPRVGRRYGIVRQVPEPPERIRRSNELDRAANDQLIGAHEIPGGRSPTPSSSDRAIIGPS